jgi:hypothetical protein
MNLNANGCAWEIIWLYIFLKTEGSLEPRSQKHFPHNFEVNKYAFYFIFKKLRDHWSPGAKNTFRR